MPARSTAKKKSEASRTQTPKETPHRHSVQFYTDDKFLIDTLSRFIGSALGAGDTAVVIATEEHRRQLAERLSAHGLDLKRSVELGRYVAMDAAETLARFMEQGRPNEARFAELVGGVITRAREAAQKKGDSSVALFGEMVALLWEQGNTEGALRLEQIWNQIAQSHSFSLVCAYPLRGFYREEDSAAFRRICHEHSEVLPAENYRLAPEDERRRLVAECQLEARALQSEAGQRKDTQLAAARFAAIVESSEDAIISKDLNGIITSWNEAAERIFGYQAEEIVGKSILTIIPPELHGDEDMILDRIRHGIRIEHFETVRLTKSGERIDVSLTVSPVKDATGRIIGAAKIARDITERRRQEEALRRAEKLAVTGRMAATIAHEINNPLEAVTNLLYLLRSEVSVPLGRDRLALAETELRRVSAITRQTLAFYRESTEPEEIQLPELLDDVVSIFDNKLKRKHIEFTREYEPCVVRGMKGQLRQLFSNLIDNSVDAAPDGGTIQIAIRCNGTQATVSVHDNGGGIAPEHLSRLFEPFFTLKKVGTGLGLWVAEEIATKHGGHIRVESSTDTASHGTTFHVTLEADVATALSAA